MKGAEVFKPAEIERNLRLALRLLELAAPICEEGGINTNQNLSYDEWEEIVRAVFHSFIVLAISDSGVEYERDEFKKMGFEVGPDDAIICFYFHGAAYYVNDLVKIEGGSMAVEALAVQNGGSQGPVVCGVAEVREPWVARFHSSYR